MTPPDGAPGSPLPQGPTPRTLETFDSAYTVRIMLVLAGIALTVLYIEGMLTPSLPTIQREFGIDEGQASLILSSYAISGVALSPVIGKLGDIYGKRRVLIGVMLGYAVSVSVTGFSPNFEFMVAARTVQGIGLTILPLGMALVREEFPRELVPRAQGILSAMFGVGFAVSLPLGSWVSQTYGWRWTYHSAIPFVLALTVSVILFLRESPYRRPSARVDYLGAVLLGGALTGWVAALSEGQAWGWLSLPTVGFAAAGTALLVPFVLAERSWRAQGREPIVDSRLLRERNVAVTNIVLTVAGLGMFLALFAMIYQLEGFPASGGYHQNILHAGLDILPLAVAMIVVAPVASIYVSRTGVKPLALAGAVLTALGFYLVSEATTLDQAMVYEFVVGSGMALLNASIVNLLVLTVDPKDMGQATAMNNVFRNLGSSVGAPIAGSLLSTYLVTSGPFAGVPAHAAFQYAFWIAAAATVVGGLLVVFGEEVLGPRRHEKFRHLPVLAPTRRSPGATVEPPSGAGPALEAARP